MKRLVFVAALLGLTAGCGLHLVSYDPEEVAQISEHISKSFEVYRESVPTPTADVQELGKLVGENLAKQQRLLRTK